MANTSSWSGSGATDVRYLIIKYDEQTADDGDPLDLFGYLLNELENAHIECEIHEAASARSAHELIDLLEALQR